MYIFNPNIDQVNSSVRKLSEEWILENILQHVIFGQGESSKK